jgi:hypothetical protein
MFQSTGSAALVAAAVSEVRAERLRTAAGQHLGRYALPMLDLLLEQPLWTVKYTVERIGGTPTTIGALLDRLAGLGIVAEVTGQRRNQAYRLHALPGPVHERRPDAAAAGPGD